MSVDDTRFRAWAAPMLGEPDGSEGGRRRARIPLHADVTIRGKDSGYDGGPAVLLPGPEDVGSITKRAIRRVRPPAGRADADAEYFPYIDFVDGDFPWRYAPDYADSDDAMQPWLVLVAGQEGTDVGIDARGRAWVSARVTRELDLEQAKLWAHVHDRLAGTRWRLEGSRLLYPRAVPDDADCLAVLVRRSRFRNGALEPSWRVGAAVGLQVLHAWRFHTNGAGTFTSLAQALTPMKNPPGLGATSVVVDTDAGVDRATAFGLLGPLELPDAGGWQDDAAVRDTVTALLESSTGGPGRPVLGPPRYGSRWVQDVESTAWGGQLNHDPRHRAIAALGTRAGIDWQEQIVEAAARRIGSTHLAAGMLAHLTAGVALTERLLERRPGGSGPAGAAAADRLAFYGPALRKVRADDGTSALLHVAGETSPLDPALLSAASLRRLTSQGRRAIAEAPAPRGAADAIEAMNECRTPAAVPLQHADSTGGAARFEPGSLEQLVRELGGDDAAAAEFGGHPFESRWTGMRDPARDERVLCRTVPIAEVVDRLDEAFDPRGAMTEAVVGRIQPRPARPGIPLRIAPDLDLPAWAWLRDHAPEWLLPRAGLIPPDAVVALRTNGAFVEAFLVGLSQQAAAELTWRGVPLASTAVPMRTIWQRIRTDPEDPTIVPDLTPVQQWNPAVPLDDPARHYPADTDLLVIAMRSEILRRYPETVVRLLPKDGDDPDMTEPGELPIAVGTITPGLWFLVFEVAPESIAQKFLVLEETIDGPRFAPRASGPASTDLEHPIFGPGPEDPENGAEFAHWHWARPVRALIDGARFADPAPGGGG